MFGMTNALDTILALQNAVEAARTSDIFGLSIPTRGAAPAVNLFQDGDNTILMAEVPGVRKEDIKVEIKDNLITISGERKTKYPESASVHRMERREFKFNRTLKLPAKVDVNKVTASYENGILKLVLPMSEEEKPKQIDIH